MGVKRTLRRPPGLDASIGRRAVEVEVRDDIVAVAPVELVCTENPIRIDWGRESPNVSAP
jgi:hypothetical protein